MNKKRISSMLCASMAILSFTGHSLNAPDAAAEHEPVEIVSLRSEYEKHFDNGDGTITAFIDTVPLHYYDNGEWLEIDNTLVQDENGNYVNKSNSMNVTLASAASADIPDAENDGQMVKVEYNGYSISWNFVDDTPDIAAYSLMDETLKDSSDILIYETEIVDNVNLGNTMLEEEVSEYKSRLESSVSYDSLFDNVDVDIDIRQSSVKETIILNSREDVPEQFKYHIRAEGLNAEIYDDDSVHFSNEYGEDVFFIPAAFMFDSSENAENNYDVRYDIEACDGGYLLTLTPDMDWILSDERSYPVMIDPIIQATNSNGRMSTISEANPHFPIYDDTFKVGGKVGDRYETIIENPNLFIEDENTAIQDAYFNFIMKPHSYDGRFNLSLLTKGSQLPNWQTFGGDNNENTKYVTTIDVKSYPSMTSVYSFDITELVQSFYNYQKTGGYVGAYPYGLKISLVNSHLNSSGRIFEGYSSDSMYSPNFGITYTYDEDFWMEYTPHKYNDYMGISNFQSKMNCYAYALQVYYRGEGNYSLKPGELGIKYNNKASNYAELLSMYASYKNNDIAYMNFIEERMKEDFLALGATLKRLPLSNDFVLPSDFNENNERIIAMVSGKSSLGTVDYHYYLRNGNGTCPNGHGGTCSAWSYKSGNAKVSDSALEQNNNFIYPLLCDANISIHAREENYYNSPEIRYYSTSQDMNLYNSCHGNGKYAESTGTPYYTN